MINVAINGFGRIGRTTLRAGFARKDLRFVAINDLADPKELAHLLKYDSVFRTWDKEIVGGKDFIKIGARKIPVYGERNPADIPWGKHKVDVVIEATGFFKTQEKAHAHIDAGARKVVISAPSEDVPTFLMGVNHRACKANQNIVSNASCTTNSVAPVAQVLSEAIGIKKAMLTTIHSVTAQQNTVDGLVRKGDLRRARSALTNIIPTTTGAAIATTKVLPELTGKFDGIAVRVPSLDVSLTDFTFVVKKKTSAEEINALFKKAAKSARWKGILGVTDEPLVSTDFIGTSYGSVVDLGMTRVVDGDLVKVLAWYDNEWGYTQRLLDLAQHIGNL